MNSNHRCVSFSEKEDKLSHTVFRFGFEPDELDTERPYCGPDFDEADFRSRLPQQLTTESWTVCRRGWYVLYIHVISECFILHSVNKNR